MKRTIIAVASLLLSLIICFAGYFTLKKTCNDLEKSITEISFSAQSNDIESAKKKTEETLILWEETHGRIEALTPHSEIDELEEIVKSLPVYARQGDMERLEEKSEIAINRLEHIIKNETPSFSNIF